MEKPVSPRINADEHGSVSWVFKEQPRKSYEKQFRGKDQNQHSGCYLKNYCLEFLEN